MRLPRSAGFDPSRDHRENLLILRRFLFPSPVVACLWAHRPFLRIRHLKSDSALPWPESTPHSQGFRHARRLITFPHESGKDVSTLPEGFQETIRIRPDAIALRNVGGSVQITWRQYGERVRAIAQASPVRVKPGDTVGIMLTNRPEFHLVDTAVLHLGAVPFSIYNTSAPGAGRVSFRQCRKRRSGNRIGVSADHHRREDRNRNGHHRRRRGGDPGSRPHWSLRMPAGFDFDASWRAVTPRGSRHP